MLQIFSPSLLVPVSWSLHFNSISDLIKMIKMFRCFFFIYFASIVLSALLPWTFPECKVVISGPIWKSCSVCLTLIHSALQKSYLITLAFIEHGLELVHIFYSDYRHRLYKLRRKSWELSFCPRQWYIDLRFCINLTVCNCIICWILFTAEDSCICTAMSL